MDYAAMWQVRCMHEASLHDSNRFVTLTYDTPHLPPHGILEPRDLQLFLKRLRKRTGQRFRFFACGEYGGRLGRPHFHALLFGLRLPDEVAVKRSFSGHTLYRSELLGSVWGLGFHFIGGVTAQSAGYVARYVVKKVVGKDAQKHYETLIDTSTGEVVRKRPEFVRMSLRPGIGARWFYQFHDDVYPCDFVVDTDGRRRLVPAYYDRLYGRHVPEELAHVKDARRERMSSAQARWNRTPERLAVREKCMEVRTDLLGRQLE